MENGGDLTKEIVDEGTFATRLDVLLARSPLSLRELAKRTGIPATTLSSWRKGRHLPYPRQRDALEQLLGELGVSDTEPWIEGLDAARMTKRDAPSVNPYRGLVAFSEQDSDLFFGRGDLADELLEVSGSLNQRRPPVV